MPHADRPSLLPSTRSTLFLAAVIASGCASCAHSGRAAVEPRSTASTPDAIFAYYFDAIGGRDRLERIESRHMWGVYREGALTANTDGRRGAEFDEPFVDYEKKGHHASVLGGETFEDRPAHRVRVTLADGWEKQYLFDDVTGLILALRKAMPIHATGAPVTSVTTYEDWRPEGGVLQPHRFVEREFQSGKLLNSLQWDSIRTNVDAGPRELGRPPDR